MSGWHSAGVKLIPLAICSGLVQAMLSGSLSGAEAKVAQELKVAAVQMRSTRDLAENLARITNSIHDCARSGARVVAFPECALTGYFADAATNVTTAQLAEAEAQIAAACRHAAVYALVGSAWREEGKLFNSALIFAPSGKVIERYHKIQLAERWPAPGDHLSVFKLDGVPCSVIICHDERYPELVRLPVLAGAKVIFYLSHESGLRNENKINPYRAQIQARAVENNVFVVHANAPANEDTSGSHGHSRVIAPDGNILREASVFGEDVLIEMLDLKKATRANAENSVKRGPLGDWWKAGLRRVRVIEDDAAPATDTSTPASVRVAGVVLKWIRGDKEANFRRAEPMIREAAANGAKIVCTTECFLDGYAIADKSIPLEQYRSLGESIPTGKYFQRLAALAGELRIHLIAGMTEADGEARYNTSVLLGPDGRLVGKYHKQKLQHELVRNTPGNESPVFATPYGRVGLIICADRTEPGIVQRICTAGADFLICPSGGMFGPQKNDPIVQARSRENRVYIVFTHPAQFLVTAPDGSMPANTVLGDQLLIAPEATGTAKDANRIFYFDLPLRRP